MNAALAESLKVPPAPADLNLLNSMAPDELLRWAWKSCRNRAGLVTSFQISGSIMIDMARRAAPGLRVLTIDPLRLHPETYQHMDEIEAHYGIRIERFQPCRQKVTEMTARHGEFLFFDSKAKQEYCCFVRKVEPQRRLLASLDVWISGLRQDQSPGRKDIPKAAVIEFDGRQLLKLCPLAEWTEAQARDYVERHQVPVNPLYQQGYASIGCVICSTPVLPREKKRAGRWRWFNQCYGEDQKECGLHTFGSGI